MGKTTLWSAGVAQAEERGPPRLRALPAESETELSFAGLAIFSIPSSRTDDTLTPAQTRALARLVLEDAAGPDPHRRSASRC